MAKYRKKPVEVEVTQWFRNGDHPEDNCPIFQRPTGPDGELFDYPGEGEVVRYYRHPNDDGQRECEHCGRIMHDHGWIDTIQGGHVVCPGDYIIRDDRVSAGRHGHYYPCKPDIFEQTYEPVE